MTPLYRLGTDGNWSRRGYPDYQYAPVSPYPALPDLPTIRWQDLYVVGDTFQQTLDRMTDYAVIKLPNGFDEDTYDFTANGTHYSAYGPLCLGFWGNGVTQARLRLAPFSSTQESLVPPQSSGGSSNPLTILRIGAGPSHLAQTMMVGMTLEGTAQASSPNNTGASHNYAGVINYYGRNSIWQDLLLTMASVGDSNSPPGETFSINNFHDIGTIVRNVEADGISNAGDQMGGSPWGGNNSTQVLLEDCYFHDSRVSSLTFSLAGSAATVDNISKDITTNNCKVWHNANHVLGPGTRFTGVNHEHVGGYVRHNNIDIIMDNMTEWNASHMSFVSTLADNPNIEVTAPNWHSIAPTRYNGCFMVSVPTVFNGSVTNKQTTPPTVVSAAGVTLTPFIVTANGPALGLNPATQYVLLK